MKISYNWLKDYITIKDSAKKIADRLTMAGLEVGSVKKIGSDYVYEAEITSNRADWLSMIGVAREICALTGAELRLPVIRACYFRKSGNSTRKPKEISIQVKDKKGCPLYTGRFIKGVKVKPSPKWLKQKIENIGLRSVNNIVDITNFCLYETGQPLHAFDLDKIEDKKIIVRKAIDKEEIKCIDGSVKGLDAETLIIADGKKPVAIAGVIGGKDTEVTDTTTNILLESAYFEPLTIRRASRKYAISTDSSYRFERNVDVEGVQLTSKRAVDLILELAGGELVENIEINGLKKSPLPVINLRLSQIKRLLGITIPVQRVKSILKSLGFIIIASAKDKLKIKVPSFRKNDVFREADLIEEISRIYGYDNIPFTMPLVSIKENSLKVNEQQDILRRIENKSRKLLFASGVSEVVTLSLIGKDLLNKSGIDNASVEVANPLSAEQRFMRPSLIPGILGVVSRNLNRQVKSIKIFELGTVHRNGLKEEKALALAIAGDASKEWFSSCSGAYSIFDIKGVIENVFAGLGIKNIELKPAAIPSFNSQISFAINISGKQVGSMGQISKDVLNNFDIEKDVFTAEIILNDITGKSCFKRMFAQVPKYPAINRDIAILVSKEVSSAQIEQFIFKVGGALIKKVRLFDLYQGKQIEKGKRSLAYSVEYRDDSRTLTDEEINPIHTKVRDALVSELNVKLR